MTTNLQTIIPPPAGWTAATADLTRLQPPATPTTPRLGETFSAYLNRPASDLSAAQTPAQARKAAEGLVANALILPVLKQLRHDPFGKNNVFSPGIGEKTFGPEFDRQIADRIAQSPRLTLTASLTQRLLSRGQNNGPASNLGTTQRQGVDVHG